MKKTVSIIALALIAVLGSSQIIQDRQVGDFTGIKAGGNFKVTLSQGDANTVKVKAEEVDQAKIKTEVKDGNLIISGQGDNDEDVQIHITVKNLNMLEVSGASSVKTDNQISADKLKLEASGAGSIKMDVKANEISGVISGAGGVKLMGTSQQLSFDVSGAGSLKAFELEADKVSVNTTGASTAKVNAKSSINATSSGASSITFKGDPSVKSVEASGASSVTHSSGDDVVISKNDTMQPLKVHMGKNKITISNDDCEDDHKKHHDHSGFDYWTGIDIGMNGYLNAQQKLDMPANNSFLELNYSKSLNFDLNLFEKNIHIVKNYVNLIVGMGFEFDHYAFKNSITLDPNSSTVSASMDSTISYRKNKLNVSYVDVPLLLMFNTNNEHPSKGFHIGGGVIGGYKIRSITKQEYNLAGYEYDIRKKDDYNLNPFKLSATVRAGFGGFNLFATYALTSLFESNKGPQLYPFTVGISFSGN